MQGEKKKKEQTVSVLGLPHTAAISRDGLTTGINLSVIRAARQKADETETRLIDTCEGGGKR